MKRISRKERREREVFPNEDLKDANKQLRCNVDVNDDDDCLRDGTVFLEHESHGLHEFCTTLRPCAIRMKALVSHRNHGKHRKASGCALAASGVVSIVSRRLRRRRRL